MAGDAAGMNGSIGMNDGTIGSGVAPGLAGRYATALFGLARERGAVDAVDASLTRLEAALAGSNDLRALVGSPLVRRADAARAVGAVAAELGLHPLLGNTLGVLARNGRLAQAPALARSFRALAAAARGQATAEVTAAHPLNDTQRAQLLDKLRQRTGRDVALDVRVDPEILGGLIVKIGSRQIDSSLKTRLERLGQAMKG